MGLFRKVFGKEDKKDSCCCDMEIVEVPEGEEAPAACECDSSGAVSYTHLRAHET